MAITVSWSGLDRVRKTEGWVFEVVAPKTVDRDQFRKQVTEASEAAELILNQDPDFYGEFSLPNHFMTEAGVGYWNECATEKKRLRLAMEVFTQELENRGIEATIRALRQNAPEIVFENRDGISSGSLINGARSTEPRRSHIWLPDPAAREAIFEQVLPWCADYGNRWWLGYDLMWLKVGRETFSPLAKNFVLNGPEPTTLIAVDKSGNYRSIDFGYDRGLVVSAGGPDPDRLKLAEDVIGLLASIAPHVSHSFVAAAYTGATSRDDLEGHVFSHAGHSRNDSFVRNRPRPTAAFAVLGAQILGPEFPEIEAAEGWTLTQLPGDRRLLVADDRQAWFGQRATGEQIASAGEIYRALTDTDPNQWRRTAP